MLIGCSIIFTIHFGVPLFLETPIYPTFGNCLQFNGPGWVSSLDGEDSGEDSGDPEDTGLYKGVTSATWIKPVHVSSKKYPPWN